MSIPPQKTNLESMASSLDEPYRTDLFQATYYDTAFPSQGSWTNTHQPMEDQVPPMGVLREALGYSDPFVEYFREHQNNYECFPENLAGVLLEGDPVDDSSRYFNRYPPPTNTWEMGYTTSSVVVDPPVGPSSLAPASDQPPPAPPPPATSTPNSRPEKLYNCIYCGTLFDRYSRARDCRNMDLGLTPHRCLGKCGIVGCPVEYGSEALLLEHTKPRAVQCPSCPRTLSKKNMARHRKEFCPGRNLPAGPLTTGEEN